MTALALLLLGLGAAELVAVPGSRRSELSIPLSVTVVAIAVAGALLGYRSALPWLVVVGALVAGAWLGASRVGSIAGLWVAAVVAVFAVLFGQHLPRAEPPIAHWYASLEVPALRGVPLDRSVFALGSVVFLADAANNVVRLVLRRVDAGVLAQETSLKGGRLIGPLERVFIFAMAASGNYVAATAVMAAKGILRYPEIAKDDAGGDRAEYVLIGSFVSWALAFALVALI